MNKKLFIGLMTMILLLSCNSKEKKEDKLLNKQHELERVNKLNSDIMELVDFMNDGFTQLQLDSNGNISYDSGTFSTGRFSGNLKDLKIEFEYKTSNPMNEGTGAPGEGQTALIYFNCKDGDECISDLGMTMKSGYMTFMNMDSASKVYKLLTNIQNNLE